MSASCAAIDRGRRAGTRRDRRQRVRRRGWAIDAFSPAGTGIDAIHVWGIPISNPGPAVFLGATTTFVDRPDVGAIFGARFTQSGYGIIASLPAAGAWDIYVFARSFGTGQFDAALPVRVIR
jgi:hypothetical protein